MFLFHILNSIYYLKCLYLSSNLNTDFVPPLIRLIDICLSWLFFSILISIVPLALHRLELIELLLEHIVLYLFFAKVVTLSVLQMTQFSDKVNIRLISHLKLLKYFNGTAISTFAIPTLLVLLLSLDLNLNDWESVMLPFWSPFLYWHRLPDVFW